MRAMENDHFPERNLRDQLREIDQPHQIALALVAHVLQKPKTWLLAHPEAHLSFTQQGQLDSLLERLEAGEPLPYILGQQDFFGLLFEVNPSVLIPRPETELLVEEALEWLLENPYARTGLDVGTGSGCIAISLAVNCPDLKMIATDVSADALQIANRNANRHQIQERIRFLQCDLLPSDLPKVDLICANLPYIPTAKLSQVNSLPWEPRLALDGGEDGLGLIRKLLQKTALLTSLPGLILIETEETLGDATVAMAKECFPAARITLLKDLSGRDRLVRIENKA